MRLWSSTYRTEPTSKNRANKPVSGRMIPSDIAILYGFYGQMMVFGGSIK